jgi:hypothetical protein
LLRSSIAMAILTIATLAAPLTTSVAANAAPPPKTVVWSAAHETASALGERWVEQNPQDHIFLVLVGKLTNTGAGCYSVWTRFHHDFAPGFPQKWFEICGAGSVNLEMRKHWQPTMSGYVAVCKGTDSVTNCGSWQSITHWPI